jgi:hypothetical protein
MAMLAPACVSTAISVGATTKQNDVAWFSNVARSCRSRLAIRRVVGARRAKKLSGIDGDTRTSGTWPS